MAPNRSHALAMNWIFYNLVVEIKPYYFGYLDHDCFPYKNLIYQLFNQAIKFTATEESHTSILTFGIFGLDSASSIF